MSFRRPPVTGMNAHNINEGEGNSFKMNSSFEDAFMTRMVNGLSPILSRQGLALVRFTRDQEAAARNVSYEKSLQSNGDLLVVRIESGCYLRSADLKVERKASPNLFFETFSNVHISPMAKLGWGYTAKVDEIWYAFDDLNMVAFLNFHLLREWLNESPDGTPRHLSFRHVPQTTHNQKNVTMGILIPFRQLPLSVFEKAFKINGEESKMISREAFLSSLP